MESPHATADGDAITHAVDTHVYTDENTHRFAASNKFIFSSRYFGRSSVGPNASVDL